MSDNAAIQRIQQISPENLAAQSAAARMGSIKNFSTDEVQKTEPFPSRDYDVAFRAQSGLDSSHLEMASSIAGMEPLQHIRSELEPLANQLRGLSMPNTQVSVDHIKMEVPFDIKHYAEQLDQGAYNHVMHALLGDDRLIQIHRHTLKANQAHTPALWLNQAICIETKRSYVMLLFRDIDEATQKELAIDPESEQIATKHLRTALGGALAEALAHIAAVNKFSVYVTFVLLVDRILERLDGSFKPKTAASIWEFPTAKPAEKKEAPDAE